MTIVTAYKCIDENCGPMPNGWSGTKEQAIAEYKKTKRAYEIDRLVTRREVLLREIARMKSFSVYDHHKSLPYIECCINRCFREDCKYLNYYSTYFHFAYNKWKCLWS